MHEHVHVTSKDTKLAPDTLIFSYLYVTCMHLIWPRCSETKQYLSQYWSVRQLRSCVSDSISYWL